MKSKLFLVLFLLMQISQIATAQGNSSTIEAQRSTPSLRGSANASIHIIKKPLDGVKALLFDTFGTVVDWRGSIIEEGKAWGKSKSIDLDWGDFADLWIDGYGPAMEKVRKGELPWTNLDVLHRMILEEILKEFPMIPPLTEEEKDHWNRVWRRLKPWSDSVPGLELLKKKYTIAPLSNGNVAMLIDMAKYAGLPWDAIMSAELAKHYKPDPEAYLTAVRLLGLKPEEVMMCAAHLFDLNAARSLGLRTGFIYRPNEVGPHDEADKAKPGQFDVVATDMLDLASQLGLNMSSVNLAI